MVRRQTWAVVLLFLLLLPAAGRATIDFGQQKRLNAALGTLEALYAAGKWDEAVKFGRQVMADAPAGHPVRQRAYDIVVLSLDKQTAERVAREKAEDRAKRQKTAADETAAGNKLLTEKKFAEAAASFKRAIKAFGGDAETWYLLGYALLQNGEKEEAYRAFQKCLSLNDAHPRALFHLAELAYAFKKPIEAEDYTRRLIAAIDKRLEELAAIFLEQKAAQLNDKAVATARKINGLKRNLAQATYVYGLLTKAAGDYEAAKNALKRSTQLDPTNLDAFYHLGRAFLKLRIYHQSSLAFEQAIALGETRAREMKAQAKKLLDQNKADEAVEMEMKAKAIERRLVQSYYGLAICNWSRRDHGTALESIDKALEIDPEFLEGRFARAVFLAGKREYLAAISEMRQVLRQSPPKSPQAARTIKAIKLLMDRVTSAGEETARGRPLLTQGQPKVFIYPSGTPVKHLPGLGGRRTERDLENLYPGFREVQDLLDKRNIPEAIRRLLAMQKQHQDIAEIPNVLGWCYMELGRFEEALDSFKKARALDPRNAESLSNIAYLMALKGRDLDQALALADQAIALEAGRAEFHHTRGWVRFKMGQIDKAIADLDQALALRPTYLLARYNLGLAHYLATDYAKALACFDAVLAARPDHTKAALFKAITLAKTGKAPEAIAMLAEMQKKLPPTEVVAKVVKDLHDRLAAAHERHADLPVPTIKTTVPLEKMLKKAMDYRAKGLVNHAREIYLELQRLAPHAFEPWYELGDMYAKWGLSAPALRAWEKAATINPNHYDLQFNLGKMRHRLRQREAARDAFLKAQGINPNDPEPPYYLGLMAYEEGQFEAAESYGLAAVRNNPRHLKSWALLGLSRIRLGRYKPARDAYETLYTHAPADSSIKRHARKKLWELSRLMAPARAPSYEHVKDVAQQLSDKATGANQPPIADLPPPPPDKLAQYGPSMSYEEKMRVLKHLQNFPVLARPPQTAPLKVGQKPTMTEAERRWVSQKLSDFKAKALKYAPPEVKMSSKYQLTTPRPPSRPADPADDLVKQGLEAAEKGFMGDALAAFVKAREASPKNLDVLMNLGYLHLLNGNFKDAFEAVSTAVGHHPTNPFPRLALGNLYWLGGKGQEAVSQWEMMSGPIRFDPTFVLLGRSEKVWKRVLDSNPGDADAHSNLAVIYLFTGRFPEAIAECKNVIALAPSRAEHQFYQAMAETILYLKAKSPAHKKEARALLNILEFMSPPFPHSRLLRMYVETL